jgi:hypothetical protein
MGHYLTFQFFTCLIDLTRILSHLNMNTLSNLNRSLFIVSLWPWIMKLNYSTAWNFRPLRATKVKSSNISLVGLDFAVESSHISLVGRKKFFTGGGLYVYRKCHFCAVQGKFFWFECCIQRTFYYNKVNFLSNGIWAS